jgi:hypothetical protein
MVAAVGHPVPVAPRFDAISELTRAPSPVTAASDAVNASDRERTSAAAGPTPLAAQNCVLVLADIAPASRLWGWSRVVRGIGALDDMPGLRFGKVLGSGHEGGFGLKPSASRQGLFLAFDTSGYATNFIVQAPLLHAYRARARELLTVRLAAYSVRGSWGGTRLDASAPAPADGPIAALTRASIRLAAAARFWRHAPPSQDGLAAARGCLLAVGLGEAPLLRQATFSLWDSARSMDAYARTGPHLAAIRASASQNFFSESMFVRFVPLEIRGTWMGRAYSDDILRPAA